VNQKLARRILEKLGFTIDLAQNGREAFELANDSSFDLVFMDCQMPELDGYAATRQIRAGSSTNAEVPIVAMTANAMSGDREACLAAGMADDVSEPIRRDALNAAISSTLGSTSTISSSETSCSSTAGSPAREPPTSTSMSASTSATRSRS